MNVENKKLVIFDFDGVLANTIPFCLRLHQESNKNFSLEKLREICLGNFLDGINKIKQEDGHIVPDDFHDKYRVEAEKIRMEDVLKETVESLSKNYILTIVSSSPTISIKKFLEREKMDIYFSDILGTDIHENKTVKIISLLKKYEILSDKAIFVTDTLGDIIEGNKCDVKSIAVTWGLHERGILEKGNPAVIIDDPRDLVNSIQNILK